MDQKLKEIDENLDKDQRKILFILSLYSSEEELTFLQYTGWLALSYYLMKKGFFPNYKNQLLIYDYKSNRRYIWEDKKFMRDVNILRKKNLVIRAKTRSQDYRDINAHQCSKLGHSYLNEIDYSNSSSGKSIRDELSCNECKSGYELILEDEKPVLRCSKCEEEIIIKGFLRNLFEPIGEKLEPFTLD